LTLAATDTLDRRRAVLWTAATALLYTALAFLLSLSVWADPTHVIYGHGGDEQLTMSFFALVQHALGSLHDPFFTTYLNAPHGVNLAWETTSPLLAVMAWPFDMLFGPLVGFNLLCTAAFALSGLSAYVAIARLVHSRPAGIVGGLLYGFSPFMDVHGSLGQLELSFLVTPPLLALVLHSILCGDQRRWVRHGLLLAALLVAQFYISVEVLFIEVLSAAVVIVLSMLMGRHGIRARASSVMRSIGLAAVISFACTAFAIYVMFTYPYRPLGTVQPSFAFPTDALNLVTPTFFQLVGFPASSPVTAGFDGGDLAEATGYIGLAMTLVVLVAVWRLRRNRVIGIAALTGVIAVIASLGGRLHVAGHVLNVPLPWSPFLRLPIFENVLPARFSLVVDFSVALLAAALLADALRDGRTRRRSAVAVLVGLALIAYVPSKLDTSTPPQPTFFTADALRIPAGSTVLIAPLPFDFSWDAELWQADALVRFRILGGYIHGSEVNHPATIPTLAIAMQSIEQGTPAAPDPAAVAHMREELVNSGVQTVILGPAPSRAALHTLLAGVCGRDGVFDQGVEVWWTC
jgi:hypothetical protein